ncbi:MAG: hypothetical protein AB7T06_22910 [Kofleriaceae bacterium]
MKAPALILFLAACSGGGGDPMNSVDGGETPDAPPPQMVMDAPPTNVPSMITIKGTTTERGLSGTTNVAQVVIAVYKVTDEATPIAMTTSDAMGNFTLTVPTGGVPLDGFVKATKASYLDLYLYPPAAWIADDMDAGINMMTPGNRDLLNSFASGGQMANKGMVGIAVFDASGMPVSGATFTSAPAAGATKYMGGSGLPDANATMTSSEGVGFLFNTDETVLVSANKAGMTFHAHTIKARPGTFTTTSVAP